MGLCDSKLSYMDLTPKHKKIRLHEDVNIVHLPCYVGDVIKYTDELNTFEFVVEKVVIDIEETRIYGYDRGCVIYLRNFNKYCENISEKERIKEREYYNGEY